MSPERLFKPDVVTARSSGEAVSAQKQPELDAVNFQLLIDSVVDYAIYMIGLDGSVRSWNAGAARLKGYTAEEIIGKWFGIFYSAADQAAGLPQTALQTARDTGRFAAEGWRFRKDGSRFWASVVIDAIRDPSGQLVGFAKITRDVTDRQDAQNQLLESERRYRRLVESVIDYAIFQLDPTGVIATWNPGAERIKGFQAEEIIGQHFSRFYTQEDRDADVPARALKPRLKKVNTRQKVGASARMGRASGPWRSSMLSATSMASLLDLRK